jgi:hypothetical protein
MDKEKKNKLSSNREISYYSIFTTIAYLTRQEFKKKQVDPIQQILTAIITQPCGYATDCHVTPRKII